MKINKCTYKIVSILVCIILSVACLPLTAFARVPIDLSKNVMLTIQYPCNDTHFQIFKVASVSAYGEYTLVEDFKNYAVSLNPSDKEGWRALASTLSGYAARDNLMPQRSGSTDIQGQLVFAELTPGLYLVVGESCFAGKYRYTPSPILIALPSLDEFGKWVTEVVVSPKYIRDPDKDTVAREVIKIWKNDKSGQRPDYIDVQLLRDGKIWDTVKLDENNSWRHTWKNLDAKHTWQVVEKDVPDGYSVTVQLDGKTFVITNSAEPIPSTPDSPAKPNVPPAPNVPKLPQTGVLWWPVGVLAVSGMLLLLLGLSRRKHDYEEE